MLITLPIEHVAGIWTALPERSQLQKVEWRGRWLVTPFFRSGIVAFADRALRSRLFLFVGPVETEAELTWALDQEHACYQIRVSWPDTAARRIVRLSTAHAPVSDLVPRLLAQEGAVSAEPPLPAYFEPSYCTWYAYHGALDQKAADACAAEVARLGFGTFIMDDGWSYEARQRVGAELGPWHRFQGDWEPARTKFPDFLGHIERTRSLGLRYLLWYAPFLVGVESRAYRRLRDGLLESWLPEGYRCADPRREEGRRHLLESTERLVSRYPVDGFKVDYDYALIAPGDKPHGLGAAYARTVRDMIALARRLRPGFEWNLMPTPFSVGAAQAFRCRDVPFDPETNRLTMVHMRALTGRAPLYYDPSLWSPGDSAATVHRHLAPSLFCVPSVGAPLFDLPPGHRTIIRGWLHFYRRHQRTLNQGRFEAAWAAGDYQVLRASLGDTSVLACFSAFPAEVPRRSESWIINASDQNRMLLRVPRRARVALEDAFGRRLGRPRLIRPGLQELPCPIGAVAHFSV